MAHLDDVPSIAIQLALDILEMGDAVNPICLQSLPLSRVIIELGVED